MQVHTYVCTFIHMCVSAGVLVVCVTKLIFKVSMYFHTVYINPPLPMYVASDKHISTAANNTLCMYVCTIVWCGCVQHPKVYASQNTLQAKCIVIALGWLPSLQICSTQNH